MTKSDKVRSILKPHARFIHQNNTFYLNHERLDLKGSAGEGLIGKIQTLLKKRGLIYYKLITMLSPVFGSKAYRKTLNELLSTYNDDHVILNVGSGPVYIKNRRDIINLDLFAFDEVDIVYDGVGLPFLDDSVDMIINIAMLEHTADPNSIVKEMHRILKKGGFLICYVPFMVPFHAAPDDYYRWTKTGCRELFSVFENAEVSIGAGPTSGALWVVQEWLSILFSFGNKSLHDILLLVFMVVSAPLKLIDIIIEDFPQAKNISSGFITLCRK